jgi:V8-like Glu-specific endopeptidase
LLDNLDRLLVRALADGYPDHIGARRLWEEAKVPRLGMIAWTARPLDTWHSAIKHARAQGKLLSLLDVALDEDPENAVYHAARHEELQRRAAEPAVLRWHRDVPPEQLEKIMGSRSTLLSISFLAIGMRRAKAVARVTCHDGALATGFLISNDLFVTNHHVLSSPAAAQGAIAEFGYDEQQGSGEFIPAVSVNLRPAQGFATSAADDCTVVRIEEGTTDAWGAVPVAPLKAEKVEWVNIIQHPDGGPKRIALYHNVVAYADENLVQYYTDTLPGSSGSPVFDSSWNLVAVHRAGGHLYEPSTHRWVYRNEGLNVNRLIKLLSDIKRTAG